MQMVFITAIGVGSATIIGACLGFIFKKISHKFSDMVLSFAAGIMLSAAIIGLVLPSLENNSKYKLVITVAGIFCGAMCINLVDKLVPHLHRLTGVDIENHPHNNINVDKVFLFVIAIAIHNFPEGIAAGVGFGAGNTADALIIAAGIALQNIPEGMVIIAPMLATGMNHSKVFIIAALTGVIEIFGTVFGYFAVNISSVILPFALAFAGGTMIYVVSDEMIPETHSHGNESGATFSLLAGFCLMLVFDVLLG